MTLKDIMYLQLNVENTVTMNIGDRDVGLYLHCINVLYAFFLY